MRLYAKSLTARFFRSYTRYCGTVELTVGLDTRYCGFANFDNFRMAFEINLHTQDIVFFGQSFSSDTLYSVPDRPGFTIFRLATFFLLHTQATCDLCL